MKIIGLTGGSGAGKGTVARLLAARGAGWVDADAVYRTLCVPGSELLDALEAAFGPVRTADGGLDRKALAARVFADRAALERLNEITTPRIRQASLRAFDELAADGYTHILYDAPTLFQTGFDALCAETVGVLAARETRIARICARDGLTPEAAAARIDAQPDDAFYRARCTWLIENEGDLSMLTGAADALAVRLGLPGVR